MAKKQLRKPHPDLPAHGSKALAHITPDLRSLAVPIESVTEDPTNVREHGEDSQRHLTASYAHFKQRKPVVAQQREAGALPVVRAGNGTLRALKAAGFGWVAAVVVEEDDVTATAFAIADNRTAELSKWHLPALRTSLRALPEMPPGVSADFLAEIDAILDGGNFPSLPDVPDDKDGQGGDAHGEVSIKLVIASEEIKRHVVTALQVLIDDNPSWEATLA